MGRKGDTESCGIRQGNSGALREGSEVRGQQQGLHTNYGPSHGKDMGGCCITGGKDLFCIDDDEGNHTWVGGGGRDCSIELLFYSKSVCEFFILSFDFP